MDNYAMTAETSQFIIKGYDVELVNNMADLRAAIRREDKAIGAGSRAVFGFFMALKTIRQMRGVWRPLAKRFAKYWLQTKGLPDNLFEMRDFVEHDGHFYLVPRPRPDRIDPYGINKSRPAIARPN